MTKQAIQKYLPSKKFIKIILSFIAVGIVFFVIFHFFFSKEQSFLAEKKKKQLNLENSSVLEIVQSDSDEDGVADWEEALWGTDQENPETFEGIPDAEYIGDKKKYLQTGKEIKDMNELTETEKFAREFFSSYVAMKNSGGVDNNTINNFSSALGQKIADPSIVDQYTEKNILIDDTKDKQNYYSEIKSSFEKYRALGIGEELNILNAGLVASSKDTGDEFNEKIQNIAEAYKNFAKEALKIQVPKELAENHLKVINDANNTSIAVLSMAQISKDPLIGLSGLSQYQKYSAELIDSTSILEEKILE